MNVCLVLPLKSLRNGKTRLQPVMRDAERFDLIDRLLTHTLAQAAEFPGLAKTVVVTACAEARARARSYGVRVLDEPVPGLNHAVRHAHVSLRASPTTSMIVVPCDLPFLRADDLRALAEASAAPRTIALAPDRSRRGTNGIAVPIAADFEFAFGPNSFQRHRLAAERLHYAVVEIAQLPLAFDIDTPADLAEFRALASTEDSVVATPFSLGPCREEFCAPQNPHNL
jgi:2-phospho-L-lactate/phosphoenolpyruvate guanylyltransferase